jgi:hypothetical protein
VVDLDCMGAPQSQRCIFRLVQHPDHHCVLPMERKKCLHLVLYTRPQYLLFHSVHEDSKVRLEINFQSSLTSRALCALTLVFNLGNGT